MLEKKLHEDLGKTLNTYRELAIAMNSFPEDVELSISDLCKKADVHYNTARKALHFFKAICSVVPEFSIEKKGFRIVGKNDAINAVNGIFESFEMRILTKMMLVKATSAESARNLKDVLTEEEMTVLPRLIERGFVNSIEGQYFLSSRGSSLGSMGLSQIVELGIPLPWERTAGEEMSLAPFSRTVEPAAYPKGWFGEIIPDRSINPWVRRKKRERVLVAAESPSWRGGKFSDACFRRE